MKVNLKNNFLKSIITLTSGSIIAQLITLIVSPIMTRLYSADEIGTYSFILTALSMFGSVSCGRYEMSIVTEPKEKNVYSLIKLSVIICLAFSMLISVGYGVYFAFFLKDESMNIYTIMFIFVLLISSGVTNILISYNNRNKEYKLMTTVYVIRSAVQNIGIVIFGFLKFGVIGLLFSLTVGQICGLNRQSKSLKQYLKVIKAVKLSELFEVMKDNCRQPLFSAPATFSNGFAYSSINLFIQGLYGMTTLGYYSISFRVLGLPLSMISFNVAKVFFEDASREYDVTGQFYGALRKTALFLTALAIPMVLVMIFLAPPLCGILFGSEWEVAGQYIRILAPMFGIRFIVTTLTLGLQIARKQKYELILQILFAVVSILCYILAKITPLTVEGFLCSVSISFSVIYLVFFVIILRCSKIKRY